MWYTGCINFPRRFYAKDQITVHDIIFTNAFGLRMRAHRRRRDGRSADRQAQRLFAGLYELGHRAYGARCFVGKTREQRQSSARGQGRGA